MVDSELFNLSGLERFQVISAKMKGDLLCKEKIGKRRIVYWGNFKKNRKKTYFIGATILNHGQGLDYVSITHKSEKKGEELKRESLQLLKREVEKKLVTEGI